MDRQTADNEVRARLAANDPSALEIIWYAYASDMLGYLVGILGSRHEAEDVLQEVFVMMARKRKAVAGARCLKSYLFRMARNAALNSLKRARRRETQSSDIRDWLVADEAAQTDHAESLKLMAALSALPEKQRMVVILKVYREKTFREIGELLGVSENTAGSRYRYGIARLRTIMREATP